MSCNCRNAFAMYLPGFTKKAEERPKVKVIKKKQQDQKPEEVVDQKQEKVENK